MNAFIITLYTVFSDYFWQVLQVIIFILLIMIIKKFSISGTRVALLGFILLFITMIFSILLLDVVAGKLAEFVWILFAVAFVQQFYHFLKHENK